MRKTFWWTYWGSGLGALWLMGIGALLAASAGDAFDTVKSIDAAANGIFDGFGTIVLLFRAVGLISVTALNLYGGSLTLISAIDSFRRVRPTLSVRVATIGFTAALSLVVALLSSESFLTNFENFLLLILYLFIPWTAINLIDYYVVRRGHYAVEEIFKPRRDLRPLGVARDRRLRGRLRVHGPVLLDAEVHRAGSRRRSTAPTCRCSSGCRSRAGCTACSPGRSTSTAERRIAEREAEELEELAAEHAMPTATA